jgi:hypothetical protein
MTDEAVMNGGASAPIEIVEPTAQPDGGEKVETVQPVEQREPEAQEPKGVAKRIKELTDARRAAEAREERLLRLLEQNRQSPAPAREEETDELKGLKDFDYDEKRYFDYVEKRAEARAEKAAKQLAERFKTESEAMSRRAKFDERIEAFAKTVDDYHDVVTDDTPVSEAMADVLMDTDEAGALMYYLGNNPDEARKLYHMTPAKAGRELQKLEDRLVAERKKAAEKPVSKGPAPTPRIEAGDTAVRVDPTTPDSDQLSDAEWARLRKKQVERKRS